MTHAELAILSAINIASTIYPRKAEWWTRAEDIARVLQEDDRLWDEFGSLSYFTTRKVGVHLGQMRMGWPQRRAPLVQADERHHRTLWRMSDAGLKALSA